MMNRLRPAVGTSFHVPYTKPCFGSWCLPQQLRQTADVHIPKAAGRSNGSHSSEPVGSNLVALATASALALQLVLPGCVPEAWAKKIMTPDERTAISVFKNSSPSVVIVTNQVFRPDQFTTDLMESPQGSGSGFFYDNQGHIVTNYHVITDAQDIKVALENGAEYRARVVGVDRDKDIAVLQVIQNAPILEAMVPTAAIYIAPGAPGIAPGSPAVPLPPGTQATPGSNQVRPTGSGTPGSVQLLPPNTATDALIAKPAKLDKLPPPLPICETLDDIDIGQKVFAIGNPFGMKHTLTVGVVSGTGREISSVSGRPIQNAIQTDAAINPGNSGGPLLDTSGCVIGINTAIYSPSGANSGIGFAIPGDMVRNSVQMIIEQGRVVRPALGIAFAPDASVEQLGVKGVLVLSSRESGPAWKAGIKGTSRDDYGRLVLGDIITGINGRPIKDSGDLYRVLDNTKVGQTLDLEVLRSTSTDHVAVVLEAAPE